MSPKAYPYVILLAMLYGSTMIAARFVVGQLNSVTFIGLRLTLSSIIFLILYWFSVAGRSFPKEPGIWKHGTVLAVFGTAIPMNLINASLTFQSSGITSLLLTTGPAIVVIFAHFFLADERLDLKKGIGVILALTGAVLMLALGETGLPNITDANPIGYFMVFAAMISGGFTVIYTRKYLIDIHPLDVNGVRMFIGALLVLPLSFFWVGFDVSGVDTVGWVAFVWAAIVGTTIPILLAYWIIQQFGATTQAMTTYLVPIIAGLLGVWLLDETITTGMVGGMVIIVFGVVLINRRPKKMVIGGFSGD